MTPDLVLNVGTAKHLEVVSGSRRIKVLLDEALYRPAVSMTFNPDGRIETVYAVGFETVVSESVKVRDIRAAGQISEDARVGLTDCRTPEPAPADTHISFTGKMFTSDPSKKRAARFRVPSGANRGRKTGA